MSMILICRRFAQISLLDQLKQRKTDKFDQLSIFEWSSVLALSVKLGVKLFRGGGIKFND